MVRHERHPVEEGGQASGRFNAVLAEGFEDIEEGVPNVAEREVRSVRAVGEQHARAEIPRALPLVLPGGLLAWVLDEEPLPPVRHGDLDLLLGLPDRQALPREGSDPIDVRLALLPHGAGLAGAPVLRLELRPMLVEVEAPASRHRRGRPGEPIIGSYQERSTFGTNSRYVKPHEPPDTILPRDSVKLDKRCRGVGMMERPMVAMVLLGVLVFSAVLSAGCTENEEDLDVNAILLNMWEKDDPDEDGSYEAHTLQVKPMHSYFWAETVEGPLPVDGEVSIDYKPASPNDDSTYHHEEFRIRESGMKQPAESGSSGGYFFEVTVEEPSNDEDYHIYATLRTDDGRGPFTAEETCGIYSCW